MIDFHSHILPEMDDGASCIAESVDMLRESYAQGVETMLSTSHFYPYEESPDGFLRRRQAAYRRLMQVLSTAKGRFPEIILGAEVYYFPGIGDADGVEGLAFGKGKCILVEPPMTHWSDSMLDEIASLRNRGLRPVIAHLDRFIVMLDDADLLPRVRQRNLMIQVNAGAFTRPETRRMMLQMLENRSVQFIGSDCHNMDRRKPNLFMAYRTAADAGLEREFLQLSRNANRVLKGTFDHE